jgi:DNA-binding LacI/PurR family transcriptional regulator
VPLEPSSPAVRGRSRWSCQRRTTPFDDPFLGRAFADPFFGRIASGALGELADRGVHMILMRVNDASARTRLLGHLRQGDIDGVMLIPGAAA